MCPALSVFYLPRRRGQTLFCAFATSATLSGELDFGRAVEELDPRFGDKTLGITVESLLQWRCIPSGYGEIIAVQTASGRHLVNAAVAATNAARRAYDRHLINVRCSNCQAEYYQ